MLIPFWSLMGFTIKKKKKESKNKGMAGVVVILKEQDTCPGKGRMLKKKVYGHNKILY